MLFWQVIRIFDFLSLSTDSRYFQSVPLKYCAGVARETIESCVNLPVSDVDKAASKTLKEYFGLRPIFAKAHFKTLEHLSP